MIMFMLQKIQGALKPTDDWGPKDAELKRTYDQMISSQPKKTTIYDKIKNNIFG